MINPAMKCAGKPARSCPYIGDALWVLGIYTGRVFPIFATGFCASRCRGRSPHSGACMSFGGSPAPPKCGLLPPREQPASSASTTPCKSRIRRPGCLSLIGSTVAVAGRRRWTNEELSLVGRIQLDERAEATGALRSATLGKCHAPTAPPAVFFQLNRPLSPRRVLPRRAWPALRASAAG